MSLAFCYLCKGVKKCLEELASLKIWKVSPIKNKKNIWVKGSETFYRLLDEVQSIS